MSAPAIASTSLPCDRSAPRLARRWISEQLNPLGLEREQHDGAVLLVSELVTGVVVHSQCPPVVTLRIDPGEIEVAVADGDASGAVGPAQDTDDPTAAFSAQIVDGFAHRWGERIEADGTRVLWFTVANAA